MKNSSWSCSLRAISVSLRGSTEMERSAPQAADTTAAEKGGSLCTANPVNPSYFRVPSAATQRVMWLGGRDEPERDSGQGQRKQIPPGPPVFPGERPRARVTPAIKPERLTWSDTFVLWKFYRAAEITKLCMVDNDFPPRASFGNPSSAKPTEEIQTRRSPEDVTEEHTDRFSSTNLVPASKTLQHWLPMSGERGVQDFKEEK